MKQLEKIPFELRNPRHWDVMQDAMERVLRGTWGTARLTGYGLKYRMAGKTGTAQVYGIAQDEKYDEAVAFVCESGQASISMVQRRLRVGYNRAARMIEIMEKEGIVGPSDGAKPREILVRNDY